MTALDINFLGGKQTMIVSYDGLINLDSVRELTGVLSNLYEKASFDGRLGYGVDRSVKVSQDLHFSESRLLEKNIEWSHTYARLDMEIHNGIANALAHYVGEYEVNLRGLSDVNDTGFQVQRYEKNEGIFRTHIDSLPSDSSGNRVLAVIVYLNTVEHGGETNFPLHNVSVKPVAGRICLFPAVFTHPHQSRPALSSEKIIISTFITNTMPQEPEVNIVDAMLEESTHDLPHVAEHKDAPHTHFDDAFMHPHDEGNHTHDAPVPKRKPREPKK